MQCDQGSDVEACAALMSFASETLPEVSAGSDDSTVFPVNKIAAIMRRALPPGAFVSRDAKRAVQRCVCEFICFLTSEASDRGGKLQHSIDSDDILHAFRHLGFHKYSDVCQTYIDRYRIRSKSSESVHDNDLRSTTASSNTTNAAESSPQTHMALPPINPTRRRQSRPSPSLSIPSESKFGRYSGEQPTLVPPTSPDIHALKSLHQVSIEVASSLVYAWSSPILETALMLAASPSSAAIASPVGSAMSPMFLSRLQGMNMMSPVIIPGRPLASPTPMQPMWLATGDSETCMGALQSAARSGMTIENLIMKTSNAVVQMATSSDLDHNVIDM